jgi:hypothetical protein
MSGAGPIQVAGRSKAWACSRLDDGIAVSNLAEVTDVRLSCLMCVLQVGVAAAG